MALEGARTRDRVTVFTGCWLVAGFFLDGWAHTNLVRLETFFTPWHAILYSGFAAAAIWAVHLARTSPRPDGYGLAAVGAAVFLAGGVGDMAWHMIFGIERDLAALMSPTHIVLFVGAVLILSTPFRAALLRGDAEISGAALMSLATTMLATAFIFSHLSPLMRVDMRYQDRRVVGVASMLVFNALLFGPMLLVVSRWRPPRNAFAAIFGGVAFAVQAMVGFGAGFVVFAALCGGMLCDLLVRGLRPWTSPGRLRTVALFGPLCFWSAYVLSAGSNWEVEVWTGAVLWCGLSGIALTYLIEPAGRPASRELGALSSELRPDREELDVRVAPSLTAGRSPAGRFSTMGTLE